MLVTKEELEAARTPRGGYDRETLAKWGVSWPPPKGWRKRLLKGEPEPDNTPHYDGPEPTDDEFESRKHGLLAEPKATYKRIG